MIPHREGIKPTETIIKTYSIKTNLELDSVTENVKLKPYDQVFVRRNPTFHLQENVKIAGQVKYPGTYPKLENNERLSSFIERAGGLKENSNAEGAVLYRLQPIKGNPLSIKNQENYIKDSAGRIIDSAVSDNSEPISIDLDKALKNKDSKYDMVLREGDVVYIPETNPVITVKGAVQSELKIYFDKEHSNLGYYIDKAGGFGIRPWRKRIYVTYANGKSRRTHNFGFFHFYPKVEAGSTVMVPLRPEGKNIGEVASQGLVTALPLLLAYLITRL